ncbi:MAG: hypothetical protein NVSMB44_36470 [Ktedonobacteraceae bacterium]
MRRRRTTPHGHKSGQKILLANPVFQCDASSRAHNKNSSSELTFDPSKGFANSITLRAQQ